MLGVLALVPMMQFIAGAPTDQGALGVVNDSWVTPSDTALIAALAGMVAGAFVTKDVVAILFRRWQLRFMAEQEVRGLRRRLLKGYLVGPYAWHLVKNTSDKLWTVDYAVAIGYTHGFTAALGALTEVLTITLLFVSLLFVSPMVALAALVYFGAAGLVMQRWLRPRVAAAGAPRCGRRSARPRSRLQSMGAVKEVKLRRAHDLFVDEFAAARPPGARARASSTLLNELPKYLLEIVFVVGIGLLALTVVTHERAPRTHSCVLGVFVAAGSRILPSAVRLLGASAASASPGSRWRTSSPSTPTSERPSALEQAEVTTDVCPPATSSSRT